MAKLVPIRLTIDGRAAKNEIRAVGAELRNLNNLTSRQASRSFSNNFDTRAAQDFIRVSKESTRIAEINARTQSRLTQETARRVTQAKQSELRAFEQAERHKQRVAEISAKQQVQSSNNAFKAQEAAKRREYQEFVRLEREKTRVAQAEARRRQSFGQTARNFGGAAQSFGGGMQSAGTSLSAGVTLPLVTIATLGVKAAIELDAVRQKFVGIEGSAAKANERIKQLKDFAASTKGVTEELAFDVFSQLKPLKVDESIIKKQTQALGNLGQNVDFSRNLLQIFQQGFERGDIKEAIGRMPLFEQVLAEVAQKFGAKDAKGLKELKESGKLTLDEFLSGFADAVNNNPNFANAGESLGVQLQKSLERLNNSLAPLGEKLLSIIIPAIEKFGQFATFLADAFSGASPAVQTFIIAIGAIAAAAGPVLLVLGGLISAIGSIVSVLSSPIAIGITAALAGLAIGVVAAIGVVYELVAAWQNGFGPVASYVALVVGGIITAFSPIIGLPILIGTVLATIYGIWVTNFGGIRDVVLTAVSEISTLLNNFIAQIQPYLVDGIRFIQQKFAEYWNKFAPVVSDATNQIRAFLFESWSQISTFLQSNLAGITQYFVENWDSIREAVGRVMDAIVLAIRLGIEVIRQFWADHGEQIKSIVSSAWNIVKTIVTGIITQIGNVIKLVASVINGDWAGAWQAFKDIVRVGVTGLISILGSLLNIVWQTIKGIITRIYANIRNTVGETIAIGRNLVEGLIRGIVSGADALYEKARSIISNVVNIFSSVPQVESPSKVTTKIGEFIAEGLGVGLQNRSKQIKEIAKKVTKDALGEMKKEAAKAKKEFDDLLNSSFEKQGLLVQTADFQTAKSNLETLIKLRAELGLNVGQALPSTLPQITAEIDALNEQKQGREEALRLLKEYEEAVRDYGVELTHVEKIERLLNDPNKAVLIDAETAAKLRSAAADRDRLDAAKRLDDFKKSIESSALSEQFNLSEQNRLMQEQIRLGRELTSVEKERIKQEFDLAKLETTDAFKKLSPEQQESLREFIRLQNETTIALIQDAEALKTTIDANKSYSDLLSELNGKMVETNSLTEYARVQKLLETEAYKNLDAAQKQVLLNKAQEVDAYNDQIKAAEEARQKMEAIYNGLSDSIHRVLSASVRGGFKEGLKTAFDELKNFGLSLLDTTLKELSNKLAQFILKKIFGGSGSSSDSGGLFGGLFSSIFGGSNSSGGGFNLGSIFGGNSSSGGGGLFGGLFGGNSSSGGNPHEAAHSLGGNKGKFTLQSGMALAGMGLSIVGGLLGNTRTGRSLSGAGAGIGIGMAIGSAFPGLGTVVGGLIGGIAGGILGLFGDPKRKIDKQENMPKLKQGFTDAMAELRRIAADKNALYNDPEGVLAKASEIRAQIAGGFGIQFQSKKYGNIAKSQIAAKLIEADAIIKSIREMGDEARQALETDKRLETSFAGGVYMSPSFRRQFGNFKRRNGMLAGAFNGIDTLPSMLAQGEMVLNPYQIAAVKRNAGFDVFHGAGIPNYAGGTFVAPSFSAPGASAPNITFQPNITIVVEGEGISAARIKDVFVDSLESTDVQVRISKAADRGKSRTR